jgi:5-methylcytosine-specific restriction protein A
MVAKLKRGDLAARFKLYSSGRWKRVRSGFLKRNPLCRACGARATVVDHIRGHGGADWLQWFWLEANWQPLCSPCHSKKSGNEHRNRIAVRAGVAKYAGGEGRKAATSASTTHPPTTRNIGGKSGPVIPSRTQRNSAFSIAARLLSTPSKPASIEDNPE